MATNTILQSLNSVAEGSGVSSSNRRQIETYIAAETIASGDLVAFDIIQAAKANRVLNVKLADSLAGATSVPVGFALADAEAGATVDVVVAGYFENANVATGGVAGDRITISATVGRATFQAAPHTLAILGYQMAASVANVVDVVVLKQF